MLKLGGSIQTTNGRQGVLSVCLNPNYVSNFSRGSIDSWEGEQGIGTLVGGQSVGGVSDALSVSFTAPNPGETGGAIMIRILSSELTAGCEYFYSFQYRIRSSNDEITFVKTISAGGTSITIDTSAVPVDTWLTRSGTFTALSSLNKFRINFDNFDTNSTDTVYLYDIRLALNS